MKGTYSLESVNGNAFAVMGYVINAMRTEGIENELIDAYKDVCKSGSYDCLLRVSLDTLTLCNFYAECRKATEIARKATESASVIDKELAKFIAFMLS